jgi:NADH:ubiquinone oxidoreductase subunit 2 (subunit N)
MLIIAILILLLAATSSIERNYNYLADYVKLNRIVFIIFILGAYLAYNTLDVDAIGGGIGIYGGVFKITILSQVFDIVLFIIGGIVSILTCFVPYNFKYYDDTKSIKYILDNENKDVEKWRTFYLFFTSGFKDYYNKKLLNHYKNKDFTNKSGVYIWIITSIRNFIDWLPNVRINTPFLVENKLNYSKLEVKEYSLLLLYTVLGGSLLISSLNLISLYLSLELQSFTLYILSTSQIRSFKGTSGGLKYFLLGGLSSGFILLGSSLLYAYSGTLNLEHIFMIYSNNLNNYYIDSCLLIIFAGLLFKVSAAPFHNWAPDVYSDVPTYSTTWLIIIAKLSIFVLMLLLVHNVHTGLNLNILYNMEHKYDPYYIINKSNLDYLNYEGVFQNMKEFNYLFINVNKDINFSIWNPSYSSLGLWTNVLTLSAIFSLIIGTIVGLSQSRIKRLFGYSTITHVGFLLLALSLNSISSIDAFIFYLIQYTITNLNLFFILVAWGYLYSRYYLEKDFLSIRYLSINPYSWKDTYVEPTLHDFFDSVINKYDDWDRRNSIFHPDKSIKINTVHNYLLIHHDIHDYDFNSENNDWLYTPVPFLTNFKGMHFTDPFLAFCLSVTIFSLAGIPPLIGFFAKQQVLLSSMQLDYYFASIIAIITSVIGAAYYLRIIKFIYFYDDVFMPYYIDNNIVKKNQLLNFTNKEPEFTLDLISQDNLLPMLPSNSLSLIISLLTNVSLFYILKPYILINTIYMITILFFQAYS